MSFVIPGTDPKSGGKKCCPCTTSSDPCACGVTVTTECRTRAGSYILCGFDEFANPSLPPKRYQMARFSGSVTLKNIPGPSCGYTNWGGTVSVSGSVSKTCAGETGGGQATWDTAPPALEIIGLNPYSAVEAFHWDVEGRANCPLQLTLSPKVFEVFYPQKNDPCWHTSGAARVTLSSEDTESNAIKRSPAAWGPWKNCWGGTCSFKTVRKAGEFTGQYAEAELKIKAKGSPNYVAKVEVTFEQRALTGGPISFQKTRVEIYCDGAGDGQQVLPIPMAAGRETCYGGMKLL